MTIRTATLMPESDPVKILLAHDHWATLNILNACDALTPGQFHQQFEIGPGSLHNTLTHMIATVRTWTETLAGKEPGPRIDADGQHRTPKQLRSVFEEFSKAFFDEAHRLPLDATISRRFRDGRMFQFTRGAVLTHVTTHGMHHRAQCLNMLRHLGVTPLPPSSVSEWTWMANNHT